MDERRGGLNPAGIRPEAVLWHLRWRLRAAWVALAAERAGRALWPAFALGAALGGAVMLGAARGLSQGALWLAAGLAALALGVAVVRGLWRLRLPRMAEAGARLDAALPGRPFAALADRQAIGAADGVGGALWRAHLARMAEAAGRARVAPPDLHLAPADPYALRLAALTLLALGLVFGSSREIADALPGPATPTAGIAGGPAWEGWAQPPDYTGRPALYLNTTAAGVIELPAGSTVVLRLYGEVGALTIRESVSVAGAQASCRVAASPKPSASASR